MNQYPCIYSDKFGIVHTAIQNNFCEHGTSCLEMEIEGVHFKGSSLDDFELVLKPENSEEQLKRFTFNKFAQIESDKSIWVLCNCNLEIHFAQQVTDIENENEIDTILIVDLQLGKPLKSGAISNLKAFLKIEIKDEQFTSEFDYFEPAILQLQKEMMPRYLIKNCFSCHYSDYSPYGNGFYGSLMCFRNNKSDYLSAVNKKDFFNLAGAGYIAVQETYQCNEYSRREKGTGFRGWPFD